MSPDDVRMLIADLKELHHQVDFLQKDVELYRTIAAIVVLILTLVGIERVWHFWRSIDDKVTAKVETHATRASGLIQRIEQEWNSLRSSLESSLIIKAGSRPLTFPSNNYVSYWQQFDVPFPSTPVVVVTESVAGEWCYAKVDEIYPDRFKIALRTLSGIPIGETRNIQWLAICSKPTIAPLGAVEMPIAPQMPNQALEPTTTAVPPAADAPVGPAAVVAHL